MGVEPEPWQLPSRLGGGGYQGFNLNNINSNIDNTPTENIWSPMQSPRRSQADLNKVLQSLEDAQAY